MPTKDEAKELIQKCKILFLKVGEKRLVKVIGPNKKYIILPSAGFVQGTNGNWVLQHHEFSVYLFTGELYSEVSPYESADNQAAYMKLLWVLLKVIFHFVVVVHAEKSMKE